MSVEAFRRRRFVRASGAALTAGLAGCVGTNTLSSKTDTRSRDETVGPAGAELTAPDGSGGSRFGRSVATTGGRILIGAPGYDDGRGAAYVFAWTGTEWRQADRLTAPEDEGTNAFGRSVALSGDWALVGTPSTGRGGRGAGYAFRNAGDGWELESILTVGSGDAFGTPVELDGGTALVGRGPAVVFESTDGVWSHRARLAPDSPDPSSYDAPDVDANDSVEYSYTDFGRSLALGDGVALVGGSLVRQIVEYTRSPAGAVATRDAKGIVHAFDRAGDSWRRGPESADVVSNADFESGAYAANDPVGIGSAVDVSGERVLVGTASGDHGGAFLFERVGQAWVRRTALGPPRAASSVAIDGDAALVGRARDTGGGETVASLFRRVDGAWERRESPVGGVDAGDPGVSVDLGGGTAVVGVEPRGETDPPSAGSAFVGRISS